MSQFTNRHFVAALGISDEVDRLGLKGSRKKKSKKLDEDFIVGRPLAEMLRWLTCVIQPILKPLVEKDVPKVIQAIRQTQSRKVLMKLLTRIKVRIMR